MIFGRDSAQRVARRLGKVRTDLVRAQEELVVAEQQFGAWSEEDEEQRVRVLVSENLAEQKQWEQTHRHAELMQRSVGLARRRVADLQREASELLARLNQRPS